MDRLLLGVDGRGQLGAAVAGEVQDLPAARFVVVLDVADARPSSISVLTCRDTVERSSANAAAMSVARVAGWPR